MKKIPLLFLIFLFAINIKAQEKDFNDYYFNNHITFYSLKEFINSNQILIYDENKKISKDELKFQNNNNSILSTIHVVHEKPKVDDYLLLSDYIINENLAVVSFASSKRKKYIIYTLKRQNRNDKFWYILSIYKGEMN